MNGLSGVTSTVEELWVRNNPVLTNIEGLSGITSVAQWVRIGNNDSLDNLDGLSALTSVGDYLRIEQNLVLANLDGLSALTSVGGAFQVYENDSLPDCEVCDLLDQLVSGPSLMEVFDNVDDTCTPVPDNCPYEPPRVLRRLGYLSPATAAGVSFWS